MRNRFWGIIPLILILTVSANAWVLVIKGGKIFTMSGGVIEDGTIIIENNRISEVGKNPEIPRGAEIIDAAGKVVTPGLIDAFSYIGLSEIWAVGQTVDVNESSDPVTPEVRVIDAFNTQSALIPVTRIEGVTTVLSAPGTQNPISGQSAVMELSGETIDEMIIKSPAALHINFGESPTSYWRAKKRIDTRMGLAAILRQAFIEAEEYRVKWAGYESKLKSYEENQGLPRKKQKKDIIEPTPPPRDLGLETMALALDGEIPVIASAHRRDDILAAIKISEEFDFRLIILYGTEAYKIADILKKKNIPVLLGPVTTQPSSMENLGAIYENAALLDKAGVQVAIVTSQAHNVRDLRFQAGIAAQYGLSVASALKAITIYPARILGIEEDLGSIEAGKIANIAIFDGDPLQALTKVTDVIIEGRRIPMESFQTKLYEKYK